MLAEESVKAGDLETALSQVQDAVRKNPAEPKHRVFLFQLLSIMGQWDRAATQLKVLGDVSPPTIPMVQTYGSLLQCEALRREVFEGKRTPVVFGKPEEWVAMLVEALRLTAEEKFEEAQSLRERALEVTPAVPGAINEQPFAWIADADSRIGPLLEAVVNGKYYWIPFSRIQQIELEKPTDLRDLVWAPATLTLANGGKTVAFIPSRYPGSEASPNGRIRMARLTDWIERPGQTYVGLGQRMFATDAGELPLLEVRQIRLDVPLEAPDVAAAAEPTSGERPDNG